MFTNLYKTIIDCSKYNITINDTIDVTVKIVDFDEDNSIVVGEKVTITCSGGYFTMKNTDEELDTVETYTNRDGEVELQYTPTSWGDNIIQCNDATVQVRVIGGWLSFTPTIAHSSISSTTGLYNQDTVIVYYVGKSVPKSTSPINLVKVPDEFKPSVTNCCPPHLCDGQVYIDTDGYVKSILGDKKDHWQTIYYARKGFGE